MSYFDFFCKNVNNQTVNSDFIRGTCYSMCPQAEIELRQKENIVHVLEVVGQNRKLVKSYSRSAADSNMAIPQLLRPYPTLKDTVQYLLHDMVKRQDVSLITLYDFINDRLRAVRQDMTIQRLPSEECACLLEPMVRFYVYFGYRFRNYPISDYDPVLNKKYLLESLKWFLYCCDCMDKNNEGNKNVDLNTFMSKMEIGGKKSNYDRALMEAIYILCDLDDVHPLLRYLELSETLKKNLKLAMAYKIAIAKLKGNFIVVSRLMEKLCPLSYYAMCPSLPILQRQALRVLCHAYSSKQLSVPRAALQRWLRFGSEIEAQLACVHYGMVVDADKVRFSKADFKADVPPHQLQTSLHENFNQHIEDIFIMDT